ncbi:MAG: hypothetical protein IKA47_10120 [Oscillospiraceae bacterium]|nr:hypothetical protein [Oscillospiraceae bacterium]
MDLREKTLGTKKVKLWLQILLCLLSASLGLRLSPLMPKEPPSPESLLASIKAFFRTGWANFRGLFPESDGQFWLYTVLALLFVFVILAILHRYQPKHREVSDPGPLYSKRDLPWILCVAAFLFTFSTGISLEPLALRILSGCLAILSVGVIVKIVQVLRDVYGKHNSVDFEFFEIHKKLVLRIATALGLLVVGLPLWIPGYWGFTLPAVAENASRSDLAGYYTALLSLTFISISVMGVLSDRSVVIYWDNIAEGKLIKPVFGSFAAYTYYSVGATLGAGISVALRDSTAFLIFAVINIGTIILLTFTMVDVYYDREGKKADRVKKLHEDLEDYEWVRKDEVLDGEEQKAHRQKNDKFTRKPVDYSPVDIQNMHIGHRGYEEKMMLLCQYISRAYDEHDLMYLKEVYGLYIEQINCFNSPNGKRVVQRLYTDCNAETWPLMTRSIRDLLDRMEKNPQRDKDPFSGKFHQPGNPWNQDEMLWAALQESAYLRQWLQDADNDPMDARELREFIRLLARRLVLLYNDMATHCNMLIKQADPTDETTYDYLKVVLKDELLYVQTEEGNKPSPEQTFDLFYSCFGEILVETTFVARPLRILLIMLENLNEDALALLEAYLKDFPLPAEFTPYLHMFGFEDDKVPLWKKHFK